MAGIRLLKLGLLCLRTCLQDTDGLRLSLSFGEHRRTHQWDRCPGEAFQIASSSTLASKGNKLLGFRLVGRFQERMGLERLNWRDNSCQPGMTVRPVGRSQLGNRSRHYMVLVALSVLGCNNTNLPCMVYNQRPVMHLWWANKYQSGKGKAYKYLARSSFQQGM